MKLYLTKIPPFGYNSEELFTVGKWYEGDLVPTIYDPQTLKPAPASYIEWRERQLNQILSVSL